MNSLLPPALAAVVLGTLVSGNLSSQCFGAAPGTSQAAGQDTTHPIALGFMMTMPDGTMTMNLEVESHGTVHPPGGPLVGNFSNLTGDLVGNVGFFAYWDDLLFAPIDPGADILFQTTGTQAVIQFVNYNESFDAEVFNFSVELNSDGSFAFEYDNNFDLTTSDCHVGFSDGVTPDPGAFDYSSAIGGAIDTGAVSTAYEFFNFEFFDMHSHRFEHIPNGVGGYVITATDCGFPPFAMTESTGVACDIGEFPGPGGNSISYFNNGGGGYTVVPNSGVMFDSANLGAPISTFDDATTLVDLTWAFPWLGGTPDSMVEIDSNGRIAPPGSFIGGSATDLTPTIDEFLGLAGSEPIAGPCLAAWWSDLDPGDPAAPGAADEILFFTDGVGMANITWNEVNQFLQPNSLVFQVQMFSNGNIHVVYEELAGWNGDAGGDNLLIGYSAAPGVDPGESDIVPVGLDTGPAPTVYEFFNESSGAELQDVQFAGTDVFLTLTAASSPLIGGIFDLAAENMPTMGLSASILAAGVTPIGEIPFSVIDMDNPCVLVSNADLLTEFAPVGAATNTFSFDFTTLDPAAAGAVIDWQIISVSDAFSFFTSDPSGDGMFPFGTSNNIESTLGF